MIADGRGYWGVEGNVSRPIGVSLPTPATLLGRLKENPFVLAPMAGITDSAFRSFMKDLGSSIVISELVSAHGIEYGSQKTLDLMKFTPDQFPAGIQLFGETPEALAKAATQVEKSGAAFVDLNFGCPVPKVVKKGAGSAILRDLKAVRAVFRAVKEAVQIPVTVKIRTGWDESTKNASEVVQIAADEGLTWVAIHGRTRAQGYSGLADWDYIGGVKARAAIPIIGNGDIVTAEQATSRLSDYGLDGIMIGRGCLKNPWIFRESLARMPAGTTQTQTQRDFVALLGRLHDAYREAVTERVLLLQMKKFASWYSTGYPGAAGFRKQVFGIETSDEVVKRAQDFFTSVPAELIEMSMNNEGFLMGGHG